MRMLVTMIDFGTTFLWLFISFLYDFKTPFANLSLNRNKHCMYLAMKLRKIIPIKHLITNNVLEIQDDAVQQDGINLH